MRGGDMGGGAEITGSSPWHQQPGILLKFHELLHAGVGKDFFPTIDQRHYFLKCTARTIWGPLRDAHSQALSQMY